MNSLDPRVSRLPDVDAATGPKQVLDQLTTFEVFVQARPGKPYQHEGSVHAPNVELAFVLAKEAFTRRFTCSAICVCDTRDVLVSVTTEADQSVYDLLPEAVTSGTMRSFEVFALMKRGKQHVHLGTYQATDGWSAMKKSSDQSIGKVVYNLWTIPTDRIRFTNESELDFWATLPDKKFRDAADYKGGDKLKDFLERMKN